MTRLLAIDPGTVRSAILWFDTEELMPTKFAWIENPDVVNVLYQPEADELAVEMLASYGMPVGREVFETAVWIGRFIERWRGPEPTLIYRAEVKLHLCGSRRAKDPNVRQALLDLYGGRERAMGKKAAPGPLYGVSGDVWAALGVAVTAAARMNAI